MRCLATMVAVATLIGLGRTPALAQHEMLEIWLAQHPQVVERIIRLWLEEPDDPDIEGETVRLLQLETNLMVRGADVPLYLPRINPDTSLPPQLLLLYLDAQGVQLGPRDLLVGRTFRMRE